MAELSKTSTFFGRSKIGITSLSASLCVVLSCVGRGLVLDWSPTQGALPNVWWIQETETGASDGEALSKPYAREERERNK
jgi:hypothetical protein